MRNLTTEEIRLENTVEEEKDMIFMGYIAVETSIGELASLGVGTVCGTVGNEVFKFLSSKKYDKRKCRGWYNAEEKNVGGNFHIKIQTDKTAEKIEVLAEEGEGSLRYDGDSKYEGFKFFEIE